jgi:hypothetical protein
VGDATGTPFDETGAETGLVTPGDVGLVGSLVLDDVGPSVEPIPPEF